MPVFDTFLFKEVLGSSVLLDRFTKRKEHKGYQYVARFRLNGARPPIQRRAVSCLVSVVPRSSQRQLRTCYGHAAP